MKTKLFSLFVTAALVAPQGFLLANVTSTTNENENITLNSDIQKDQQKIAGLQTDITSDTTAKAQDTVTVSNQRATVNADVVAYEQAKTQFGADSTQAQAALATLKTDRTTLTKDVVALRKNVRDLRRDQKQLVRLNKDLVRDTALQQKVAKLQADISADRTAEVQAKGTAQSQAAVVKTDVQTYNQAVAQYGATSTQAQQALAQLKTDRTTLRADVVALRKDVRDIHQDRRQLARLDRVVDIDRDSFGEHHEKAMTSTREFAFERPEHHMRPEIVRPIVK